MSEIYRPGDNELIRNSSLYHEFQAERQEIINHKLLESEKAGYDIGFEQALTDWIIKHRAKWLKSRQLTRNVVTEAPYKSQDR